MKNRVPYLAHDFLYTTKGSPGGEPFSIIL